MDFDKTNRASIDEIRKRFDKDVERFSNLDTGQLTTIDAALTMELCTTAAHYSTPNATQLLDIGCGAGNYSLKMLSKITSLHCTISDLSMPMLDRAEQRLLTAGCSSVTKVQGDMRNLDLPEQGYDIILAAAVFHHLRDDSDWENVFQKMYKLLRPGGSIWISDLIAQDTAAMQRLFQDRYGSYLETLGGAEYKQKVFDYIAYEDTPRSVTFQINLLKKVGFTAIEILHKNGNFAAFGAIK
ncbi:class I SAM-dependent methyltransferase [Pedobacter duraquae]|uniref:tRNA (Cmo5U34)-methyltransferase n=1 Tax=Pedobacter duraquae TaxID=425511 RepID=A0A4R6IJV2_9SPHI|nr:class I SAM-dependent methyltransferase [Pedobacter duraquae]TDO22322.1 tRNA (cmo5U34)-methyltransferase [Pedobacter duraquae]